MDYIRDVIFDFGNHLSCCETGQFDIINKDNKTYLICPENHKIVIDNKLLYDYIFDMFSLFISKINIISHLNILTMVRMEVIDIIDEEFKLDYVCDDYNHDLIGFKNKILYDRLNNYLDYNIRFSIFYISDEFYSWVYSIFHDKIKNILDENFSKLSNYTYSTIEFICDVITPNIDFIKSIVILNFFLIFSLKDINLYRKFCSKVQTNPYNTINIHRF